jgi:hypothetical protein
MVFVSALESTSRVALSEPWVRFKYLRGTVRFEYGLGGLDGVLFGDVDREVYVASAEAEVAEFKPEAFEISERLGADVNMRLLLEAVVVAFGLEHHGDPVFRVSCAGFLWLPLFTLFMVFVSCRAFVGQADACRARQKTDMV